MGGGKEKHGARGVDGEPASVVARMHMQFARMALLWSASARQNANKLRGARFGDVISFVSTRGWLPRMLTFGRRQRLLGGAYAMSEMARVQESMAIREIETGGQNVDFDDEVTPVRTAILHLLTVPEEPAAPRARAKRVTVEPTADLAIESDVHLLEFDDTTDVTG